MADPNALVDLLDCLKYCREWAPKNVHPIFLVELQVIERIVQHAFKTDPQMWIAQVDRAHRIIDQALEARKVQA